MRASGSLFLLSLGLASLQAPTSDAFAQTLPEAGTADAATRDLDTYRQAIATLEARQGVYSMELSEAYVGLGTALRTLGQHQEAAEAFGKALQSLRISYGLNDLRQLPVLEALRATHEQLGNWDDVNSASHLIFYITRHNPDASQELRVQSLLDLGRWMRKAYDAKLLSDFEANAKALSELYDNEIKRLEEGTEYAGRATHLAALNLELAATELNEAKRKYELPITAFEIPGIGEQRSHVTQQCFSGLDRNGRPITVCNAPMEVPNVNYFLNPNVQKSSEIRQHLVEVESRVLRAYRLLQENPATGDAQTALVADVRQLSDEYNKFVELNKTRPF